jgi:hypothetical protein
MRGGITIAAGLLALAACSPEASEPIRPHEYDVKLIAAGKASNPCLEEDELAAVYVRLKSLLPQAELAFNTALVTGVAADGARIEPLGFMPLDHFLTSFDYRGTLDMCGGSGGVWVEGFDREMGAIGQNTIMPVETDEPANADEGPSRFILAFEKEGQVTVGFFFAGKLGDIERIELANGQWIERSLWTGPS